MVFDAVLAQIVAVPELEPSPTSTVVEPSPEQVVEKEAAVPGALAYPHVQPMKAYVLLLHSYNCVDKLYRIELCISIVLKGLANGEF